MVAVDMGGLWIVSCYVSPNSGMVAFTNFVNDMDVLVAGMNNKLFLVVGDFNAKAPEWSNATFARNEYLAD